MIIEEENRKLRELVNDAEKLLKSADEAVEEQHDRAEAAEAERDKLRGLLREARDACKALLVMMDRGGQPRKLDAALTWKENDDKAHVMGQVSIARIDAALEEKPYVDPLDGTRAVDAEGNRL